MQNKNEKILKHVGTSCVRHNSNGITLIALIITIIVMIILVGVTVNIALNGGLFDTAQKAAKDTQIEVDKETLISAALGALGENGEVDFAKLDANLPEGFTGSNGTYRKNGNTYKVDKYGNVTYKEPSTGDLLLLEKYFLGENGEGKDLQSIITDTGFKDDESTIPDASTSIIILATSSNQAYFKYNNNAYKLDYDTTLKTKEVELIYEPQGREGEIVKYDSNNDGTEEDWMILYDNGDNVEIISLSTMGNLILGEGDTEAQGSTNLEKAIYSYNNAITRLNNYCASLITNENKISVRSVGSSPDNPSSENSTLYSSDNIKNWAPEYNGVGKSGDMNFEQDFIRISYYNVSSAETLYYMASRQIEDLNSLGTVGFNICTIGVEGGINANSFLWYVGSNGASSISVTSKGVRPVVKLSNI